MSAEGSERTSEGQVESLRLILETEQGRAVTFAEAHEVGESLLDFFEVLADGVDLERIGLEAKEPK